MPKKLNSSKDGDWSPGWSKRDAATGQFTSSKPDRVTIVRDVLGPDGKMRRRISEDVIRRAIADSGRNK